ncbi:hypothetical protein CVIRNUC_010957 [Coccomyxa viridis]|uniref:CHCH domain-containing protein n=1 Tax=Coccomyxa viridis TaxID=1274662 RepID=A0AAV1IMP4_9CHLO|nr:hypothetical protein CVIRNUC_010957 [Coccomyxa viridis]
MVDAESTQQSSSSSQETDQQIEEGIAEALACPCVDDLRSGPCGKPFEAAFSCYLRHTAKNKEASLDAGCMERFQELQQCMAKHPEAFAEFDPATTFRRSED